MSRRRTILRVLAAALTLAPVLPGPAQALSSPHDRVVSANPADTTPRVVDGKVTAILPLGNRIVVGGTFTQVQAADGATPAVNRRGLFAFDATTGAIDPGFVADFDVSPDPAVDRAVEALAASADRRSVFVGGNFSTLAGQSVDK